MGLAGGLRDPTAPSAEPLSTLPTEWQERERGAMLLAQGCGACSWEAGMVMKPILKCRRKEATSRTFPTLVSLADLQEGRGGLGGHVCLLGYWC